jgi:hypothetical protein
MYVDDFSLNLCSPHLDYMMHTIPVYPLPLVSSLKFLEFEKKKREMAMVHNLQTTSSL